MNYLFTSAANPDEINGDPVEMSDGVQQQPQENLTGSDQSEQTQDEEEQEISEASGSVSLNGEDNTKDLDLSTAASESYNPLENLLLTPGISFYFYTTDVTIFYA